MSLGGGGGVKLLWTPMPLAYSDFPKGKEQRPGVTRGMNISTECYITGIFFFF